MRSKDPFRIARQFEKADKADKKSKHSGGGGSGNNRYGKILIQNFTTRVHSLRDHSNIT